MRYPSIYLIIMKYICIIIYLQCFSSILFSQNCWQLFGGINQSNIIHSRFGQQVVFAHTLNSPHWATGYQFGFEKQWKLSPTLI